MPTPMPLPPELIALLDRYREEQLAGREPHETLEDIEAGAAHTVVEDLLDAIETVALGQDHSTKFVEVIRVLHRTLNEVKAI